MLSKVIFEFSKARGFPIGTIRTHGGKQVIKTADGKWKPVKSNEKVSKKKVKKCEFNLEMQQTPPYK